MIKLVIVMLLAWVGFSLFKKLRQPNTSMKSESKIGEKMVACSVCDTHVSESEAIENNGKFYCSKEHAEE